ncbi:MAG TPA: hypothetical protein VF241_16225 [Propionibacteriaceae bacterium]
MSAGCGRDHRLREGSDWDTARGGLVFHGNLAQDAQMGSELDIPPHCYAPLIDTTVRIVTWNVWGLYGPLGATGGSDRGDLGEGRPRRSCLDRIVVQRL